MKYKKDVYKNLTLILQLSIHMLTPIFICVFLGIWMDKTFSVHSVIIWLILGILAGGKNAYQLAMSSVNSPKGEQKDDKTK